MHCRLLAPDLSSLEPPPARLPPGLAALLKFGQAESMIGDPNAWLCRAFGVERRLDTPLAPYALLGEGGMPGSGYWLRADPVSVQLMRNRLVLLAGDEAAPSAEEAEQFVAALNRHFSPEGLLFSAPHPRRWYLCLPEAPALLTHPLAEVHGRDIRHFLPEGEDSARWRRLLNEAQILLHSHPLNATREAAGALPINSIWPWGGGTLSQDLSAPYDKVYANDPLARGLAIAAGISHAPLPSKLPENSGLAGNAPLFVMENLGDTMARDAALENFDRAWLMPAVTAVRQGVIRRLTLIAGEETATVTVTLTRADLWKFWRRGIAALKQPSDNTGDT